MDIMTHAFVGAATGMPFGKPVLGAVVATLPDLVLGIKRRACPTALYNATHSVFFPVAGALVALLASGSVSAALCVLLSLFSHIVLDLPTHGQSWAPPLLYPFKAKRFSYGQEWEFFNTSWYFGFILSLIWVYLCLSFAILSQCVIGFQS